LLGIGAAAVIAVGPASAVGFSPSARTTTEAAAAQDPASALLSRAIQDLSTGAPPHAVRLGVAPAHVPQPEPDTSSVITGLAANGIPDVALNAYRVAAARMDSVQPSCGIDWSLLAGIGRVESNHGRFGGATLHADGTSTPRILGPALNGVHFAYIRDTDNGLYDGDRTTDRAVGPMQFIPSTWRSYAVDGNGDGVADPFNINDAALAAAHYLCVAGGDLRSDAGQRRAVLAYNHSDSYVAEVLALAHAYATGIPVADIPMSGITTGAIPPPSGNYAAPAAPGPAIGAHDRSASRSATTYPHGARPAPHRTATTASGPSAPESSSGSGVASGPRSPVEPAGSGSDSGSTGGGAGPGPLAGDQPSTGGGSGSGSADGGNPLPVPLPVLPTSPPPLPKPPLPEPSPTTSALPKPPLPKLPVAVPDTCVPLVQPNCPTH
jgi:membrane-bound lytic murein transglycosylase B